MIATKMKVTGVLLMACLSAVQPHMFPDMAAIVNRPVALPCTCSGKKVTWSIFHPITESIAECHHGTCQIKQPFQERFAVLGDTNAGNFSMSISPAAYNDLGYYKCTCDGNSTDVNLNVYDPVLVLAYEGENITLPCYGDTRRDASDAQWKKDGKTLLEYRYALPDEASAGRFTMSKEGFLRGDLSLHITSVQLSDAALYLCLIHGESRPGDPRAVLLKVEERQPEQQPPSGYTVLALGVTLGLVLISFIIFIIYCAIVYCVRRNRGPQDATANNPGPPVQEQNPMIPKNSSIQLFRD